MSTLVATNLKHNASATNNIVLDAAGNVQVAGVAANLYPLVSAAAQNSTSGTFIDFTGIPSWARRITITFNGVSTNGANHVLVQLGTSGGIETTGYLATSVGINGTGGGGNATSTAGLLIRGGAAAITFIGHMTVTLVSGNTWVSSHVGSSQDFAVCTYGGANKTLAGVLDRIRITTVGGTDLFDAGSINIMYE